MNDKKFKQTRITLIVGIVIAAIVLVVMIAAVYLNSKMNLLKRPAANAAAGSSESGVSAEDEILSFGNIDLDSIDVMENGGTIEPPEGDVNVNDGITNILLIGSDEREENENSRADSMMLVSIDSRKNTWKLVSFERGVGVSIPNVGDDWLTHTYAYGGAPLVMKTLQEYYKVDVSRYVKVDFSAFETVITDIGGVVVNMSEIEANYLNQIAGEEKWTEGPACLDGPTALVYARIRHIDSDWERVERQREVVQAAADQVSMLSWSKINLILDHVLPQIETNLTNAELWQLLFKMPALMGTEADQLTVPDRDKIWTISSTIESSLIGCDFEAEAERLNSFLLGELVVETEDDAASSASLEH